MLPCLTTSMPDEIMLQPAGEFKTGSSMITGSYLAGGSSKIAMQAGEGDCRFRQSFKHTLQPSPCARLKLTAVFDNCSNAPYSDTCSLFQSNALQYYLFMTRNDCRQPIHSIPRRPIWKKALFPVRNAVPKTG